MSNWAYIYDTLIVEPIGQTNHEKLYVLNTVLDHLPVINGSEDGMQIYINRLDHGAYIVQNTDEFKDQTNNLRVSPYNYRNQKGDFKVMEQYCITVVGNLRDREFEETFKDFQKWLCRLSKRVMTSKVLVQIQDYFKSSVINYSAWDNPYYRMYECQYGDNPEIN